MQQGRDKLEECQRRLQTLEAGRAEAALLEAMKGSDMSQLELAIDRASSAGVSPEANVFRPLSHVMPKTTAMILA